MELAVQGKKVSYCYMNSENPILKEIDFEIKQGACIVLCGKSGSGKTTLTRLLNGLSPSFFQGNLTGECEEFGLKAGKAEIEAYVPYVGSVFQNPKTQYFNVNTTAELAFPCENSGHPAKKIRKRIEEVAKQFSIQQLLDRNVFHLSGGEKQRIAFASACMLAPKLLVLDEPTSNLDHQAIEDLKKLMIKEKANGTTIVIAEHRLAWTLEFADEYWYFEDGVLKEQWDNEAFRRISQEELDARGLRAANLDGVKSTVKEKIGTIGDKASDSILLKTAGLEVGYNKKVPVYKMKEFAISRGEIVGIMGHNGAGKSTFAKTLCGLLKPLNGFVEWNGERVKQKQLLKKSFLVMQDVNYQLFSDSVREEVLLGIQEEKEWSHVLESLGILNYAENHPMSLSGGQKQRVAIASAILADKELIIMDEPTSGLDGYHMKQVGKLLQKLKEQGKAIIVITHDEELVAGWCDRVVSL